MILEISLGKNELLQNLNLNLSLNLNQNLNQKAVAVLMGMMKNLNQNLNNLKKILTLQKKMQEEKNLQKKHWQPVLTKLYQKASVKNLLLQVLMLMMKNQMKRNQHQKMILKKNNFKKNWLMQKLQKMRQ